MTHNKEPTGSALNKFQHGDGRDTNIEIIKCKHEMLSLRSADHEAEPKPKQIVTKRFLQGTDVNGGAEGKGAKPQKKACTRTRTRIRTHVLGSR